MKIFVIVLYILILCSIAHAKDIQLLNPAFFGQPTTSAIKLFFDKKAGEIAPYMITTDVKCGKYNAASVFYPKSVSFTDVRASLNKLYKNYETLSLYKEGVQALWRVADKQFAIHMVQEEDRVRIMYIRFQPTKEVFKNMLKAQGANMDEFEDNECK